MNRRRRFYRSTLPHFALLLALSLIAGAWPLAARGQDAPSDDAQTTTPSDEPRFTSIRVGFSDRYKTAHWTPVEFTIAGGREAVTVLLTVTLADGDGYPSIVTTSQPTLILPGRSTRVQLDVKPGRVDGSFSAALVDIETGKTAARHQFESRYEADPMHPLMAMASTEQLLVMLGPNIGLESALRLQGTSYEVQSTVVASLASVGELPSRWIGYDGVNTLVLATSDPALYRSLAEDSTQIEALDRWVRLGGTLLMSVGAQGAEILAPGAPLARFAPGEFVEMVPLANLAPLEEYAEDTTSPIVPPGARRNARSIEVPRLANVKGAVEAQAGSDLPLVVRSSYGLGHVVFVGVDLDRDPIGTWKARDKFVSRLLGYPTRPSTTGQEDVNQLGPYDSGDVAGLLRGKLDEFQGVRIAPFWLVALLVFGYIVLIGPVDYFLVRHVLKRMELTWITFPTIVVAVSVGAYALAFWMKGDNLLVNQVDVLDVDVERGLLRGTSWWNVFSPTSSSYDVTIEPVLPDGSTTDEATEIVSWLGASGTSLGGSYRSAGDPPLWARAYEFAPQLNAMLGVPIQVWSTKSFTSQWNLEDPDTPPTIDSSLRYVNQDMLAGEIRSRLNVPLTDCMIAHDHWAYPLGTLAADEEGRPSKTIDLRAIAPQRVRLERWIALQSPWADNPEVLEERLFQHAQALDAPQLVWRMLFFDAAGGRGTLQMTDHYQTRLDLSQNLKPGIGQAILIGRVDQQGGTRRAGTKMLLDGGPATDPLDRHWVFYRFLLPVENE